MKKQTYALIILSSAGVLISGMLWIWHYYPEAVLGPFSCTKGIYNPCTATAAYKSYAPLGIPVPVFCLFVYVYVIFIMLIADYAGGRYPLISAALAVPALAAVLLWNIIIACIAAADGQVFSWVHTLNIAVNAGVCALCINLYNRLSKKSDRSMPGIFKNIFEDPGDNPDRKAAIAYSTLFVFVLAASLFTTNYIFMEKNPVRQVSEEQIKAFMDGFYSEEQEKLELPESRLVFGRKDAGLTVAIFTDFLCSACGSFYQTEKYLTQRFSGKVKFVLYHYPLDTACNEDAEETVYENSCAASAAMEAAAEMGFLEKYTAAHFANHGEFSRGYGLKTALTVCDAAGLDETKKKQFEEYISSGRATDKIREHVRAAVGLKVEATPTIFINGRQMSGVPPKELLELLLKKELKEAEKQ